jgi:hypothetical protein
MEMQNENMNKELDRISKEKIAIIAATGQGKVDGEDANKNGIQDVMEVSKLNLEQTKTLQDYDLRMRELTHKQKELQGKMDMEKQKLSVEKQKMANDLKIESMRSKNKPKTK